MIKKYPVSELLFMTFFSEINLLTKKRFLILLIEIKYFPLQPY